MLFLIENSMHCRCDEQSEQEPNARVGRAFLTLLTLEEADGTPRCSSAAKMTGMHRPIATLSGRQAACKPRD
jgi:hypothetical protein